MAKHGEGHLYQKRGRGCWRVRWMFEGKLHDESTGTEDYEKARKVAKQKTACSSALGDVRALTARLEKAKDEQLYLEAKNNPSLTLFNLQEAFLSLDIVRRKKVSDRTIETYNWDCNRLIRAFGGNTEMRQLTKENIEKFMRDFEQSGVSTVRFNASLAFYKRVWKYLGMYDSPTKEKARLGSDDPWKYIMPMRHGDVVGKRPFTQEQLTRIWRVLDEMGDADLKLLFDLARYTGARLHDLVSWEWDEHIKFETNVVDGQLKTDVIFTWHPSKTKNSSGRLMVIPIQEKRVVDELYIRMKGRKAGEKFVLPRLREKYIISRGMQVSRMCQKVFKKAGLETCVEVDGQKRRNCVYGMHSFRHTLVSELFEKGVDLGTIQHLYTGHGSAFVTELYAHAKMDKKRADLSALAPIETKPIDPPKLHRALITGDDPEENKAYDQIKLMDTNPKIKGQLINLLAFKNKGDLEVIRDWINTRLNNIK